MKKIIITYGIPASGKSKWAKEQITKYPNTYKRINKDDLRDMIDAGKFSFENEKIILSVRDSLAMKFLQRGYSIIIDDTNFPVGGKHFKRMCEIAELVGDVQVTEKFFDISLTDAKNANCGPYRNEVPEHIIENMYAKHVAHKTLKLQTKYFPKIQKIDYDSTLPDCIIFDIDGTLAHMINRSPFDWNKVGDDIVDSSVKRLNEYIAMAKEHVDEYYNHLLDIIIFTGRDGVCLSETKKWLKDNGIFYDHIYIRPEGDSRKDSIVKKEMYDNYIKDKYNVIGIIDDRDQVVEMWRKLGLTVYQVSYGDF